MSIEIRNLEVKGKGGMMRQGSHRMAGKLTSAALRARKPGRIRRLNNAASYVLTRTRGGRYGPAHTVPARVGNYR